MLVYNVMKHLSLNLLGFISHAGKLQAFKQYNSYRDILISV